MQTTDLTAGRLLARNTIWNLLGQLLPMAVAVVAIPPLVRALGVDRFGILSLAWIVIGYFSLFDLGIGRALTKLVADRLGSRQAEAVPALVWTGILLMSLLGLLGGLVAFSLSSWLVRSALKIPAALQAESLTTFYWLSASVVVVTVTSGFRGVLEALQQFRIVNLIRIPMSIFTFAGPFLVLPFTHRLDAVVAVLVAGRVAACVAYIVACLRGLPRLRHNLRVERSLVRPVATFGGWMTVSNIISPIMAYFDRFLVGAWISVSAVAYYTAPFDMVMRVQILPTAAAGVLFPAFAVSLRQSPERTALLFNRGTKYIFLSVLPITLLVTTFAPQGLRLWLGAEFARQSSWVLRWLAAGVFINALAYPGFNFIQSAGRPDITAKIHLAEIPFYLAAVWLLTTRLGIVGTAIAWTGRVTVDTFLMVFFAKRLLPQSPGLFTKVSAAMLAGCGLLYCATLPNSMTAAIAFAAAVLPTLSLAAWVWLLSPEERALLLRRSRPTAMAASPGTAGEKY